MIGLNAIIFLIFFLSLWNSLVTKVQLDNNGINALQLVLGHSICLTQRNPIILLLLIGFL